MLKHVQDNEREGHETVFKMASCNISEVPSADAINETFQNLAIFDDIVAANKEKHFNDLFIRGCKQNTSSSSHNSVLLS